MSDDKASVDNALAERLATMDDIVWDMPDEEDASGRDGAPKGSPSKSEAPTDTAGFGEDDVDADAEGDADTVALVWPTIV